MPNVTVTLTDEEQMQLEEILLDRDETSALEFLKRVIQVKIEQQTKSHCKPLI